MPKKKPAKSANAKSAQEKLQEFLSANKITLDYEVRKNRFVNTKDGFVLVPTDKPVIIIKAKHE